LNDLRYLVLLTHEIKNVADEPTNSYVSVSSLLTTENAWRD
jgi:hypothetical protein